MKLNNEGWGLNNMLWLCAILIIALFISISIFNSTFGKNGIVTYMTNNNTNTTSNFTYSEIEEEMVESAIKYLKDNQITFNNDIEYTITLNDLIKNDYMKRVVINDKECSGYVVISKNKKAYLKCQNYITDGYINNTNN